MQDVQLPGQVADEETGGMDRQPSRKSLDAQSAEQRADAIPRLSLTDAEELQGSMKEKLSGRRNSNFRNSFGLIPNPPAEECLRRRSSNTLLVEMHPNAAMKEAASAGAFGTMPSATESDTDESESKSSAKCQAAETSIKVTAAAAPSEIAGHDLGQRRPSILSVRRGVSADSLGSAPPRGNSRHNLLETISNTIASGVDAMGKHSISLKTKAAMKRGVHAHSSEADAGAPPSATGMQECQPKVLTPRPRRSSEDNSSKKYHSIKLSAKTRGAMMRSASFKSKDPLASFQKAK